MKIGKIDFNEKLGKLKKASFNKFWKDGDFEKKTGVEPNEAHRLLKGEKPPAVEDFEKED